MRKAAGSAARLFAKGVRFKARFKGTSWKNKRLQYKSNKSGWWIGYDRKPHPFGRLGSRKHFQVDWWRPGVKGSHRTYRIPIFW
ncbi:hypothetical protein ACGFIW_07855 [Micromonospora sp. NPDC048935]|uniref:hypothetical protein n=1 Tax=Micromonospora sp. NPDC048935 TaxID=3364262 RepID=UPI003717275F